LFGALSEYLQRFSTLEKLEGSNQTYLQEVKKLLNHLPLLVENDIFFIDSLSLQAKNVNRLKLKTMLEMY
jgi:hypothetical protein